MPRRRREKQSHIWKITSLSLVMTFTAVIAIPPQAGEAISHLEDHFAMLVMTFTAVIAIPPQAGEA
ncbi:MAG TPA: hypothetical protein PKL81_05585, partial [Ferruginibacter sp.]|nr:hypothetical protein [Ferruginibacter sp.]HNN70815.1 hypothetical protein [Ferruginibacter sp.]